MLFPRVSKEALNADRRRKRDLSAPVSSVRLRSLLWLMAHNKSTQYLCQLLKAQQAATRGTARAATIPQKSVCRNYECNSASYTGDPEKERQRWREGTEGGRKSLVFIDTTLRKQTTDKTPGCLWVIFAVAKPKTTPPTTSIKGLGLNLMPYFPPEAEAFLLSPFCFLKLAGMT